MNRDTNQDTCDYDNQDNDYEVGYGKPPIRTRFKKGQSGNLHGRPKGAKNRSPGEERLKNIALEEAYRPITVRDGQRQVKIPVIQAILRSLSLKAASGNTRAQKMVVDLIGAFERQNKVEHERALQAVIEYKADWEEELQRRERTGEIGEDPVPHPDDIDVDFSNGTWAFRGPLTREQQRLWEWVQDMDTQYEETIADLKMQAAKCPGDPSIEEQLVKAQKSHDRIRNILKAQSTWGRRR